MLDVGQRMDAAENIRGEEKESGVEIVRSFALLQVRHKFRNLFLNSETKYRKEGEEEAV